MIGYPKLKLHWRYGLFGLVLLVQFPITTKAQVSLSAFVDSAMMNNPEAASINIQLQQYDLQDQMIAAVLQSPKMYLSSDVLFAPYFNNNGKPVDITPSDNAVGYDVGITNGGLYSALFNIDVPVLKGTEVNHRQVQNDLAKTKLKIRLKTIRAELQKTVGAMYFDALSKQAIVMNNLQNGILLDEQFELIKQLTKRGQYRISDYKLMQLELQSNKVMLNSSINDLDLAVRQLKAICGIKNNKVAELTNPYIEMSEPVAENSLFAQPYKQDSLSAINQQKIFNDQYRPQINVFANSGLNSTSIPSIQNHVGLSAGVHLSYTLFDGRQKKINKQQQMLAIDEASTQKELTIRQVKTQASAYSQTIDQTREELMKQKKIQAQYKNLLKLYHDELQQAQISVIDLIAYLKKYSDINLAVAQKEIKLKKLINEYNYWNH